MKQKLTHKVVTRVTQETKNRLDRIAEEWDLPPSAICRQAVRELLDLREKKNGKGAK